MRKRITSGYRGIRHVKCDGLEGLKAILSTEVSLCPTYRMAMLVGVLETSVRMKEPRESFRFDPSAEILVFKDNKIVRYIDFCN